jgi:hypothetical protein
MTAALAMALAAPVCAAPVRLDDTGTHASTPRVQMQWRTLAQGGQARFMEGQVNLAVRLNTRAWAGRVGRIHLVMAPDAVRGPQMRWVTRGIFMAGQISPGQRVLVYQGVLPGPVMEDQWALQLTADGDRLSESLRVDFVFELDVD